MSNQKSNKEYISNIPIQPKLSKTLDDRCIWKMNGECEKSMPNLYKECEKKSRKGRCFAYVPKYQEGRSER